VVITSDSRPGATVAPGRNRSHAHGAQGHLQPARRELGREDIEFIVEQDGKRFGTLLVSKGAVEWRPTNKVYRRKLNWTRFDQAMRESGRRV
jgi:hypothetical protein